MPSATPSIRPPGGNAQDKRWADYNRAIRMALGEKDSAVTPSEPRGDVLGAMSAINRALATAIADPRLIQHFCAALRVQVDADFVCMIGFDPDTQRCQLLGFDQLDATNLNELCDSLRSRDELLASLPSPDGTATIELDVELGSGELLDHYRQHGIRRVLHLLLQRADEIGGLLLIGRSSSPASFTPTVQTILDAAASSAALTLEIDRSRRHLARTEQVSRYLAANISHELRNTFSVIIGYGEILRDEARRGAPLEGTNAAMVERLYTAACEGLELLRPAFELSDPLREQTPLEIVAVDIGELIDDLVAERFCQQRPEVGLSADIAPELPTVRTDRTKLRMILEQVLSNAQKFTFAGEVTISATGDDDERVIITVADTGPGISSERLAAAFDALAEPTSDVASSGLGLYISKQLADKLGAIIDVESHLGHGTKVRITLPRQPPA